MDNGLNGWQLAEMKMSIPNMIPAMQFIGMKQLVYIKLQKYLKNYDICENVTFSTNIDKI